MRFYVALRSFVGLCLLSLSITATAQRFQEPTKEELQMTSDPKWPGAPAIFLYREETTDNFNHVIREYARIKVFTELGKDWATVEVPYSGYGMPPRIEGRTIHADGTVVPLTGNVEDLLLVKTTRRHFNARVFSLPAVELGSILEYRWTLPIGESHVSGVNGSEQGFMDSALANSIPYWEVQTSIPIRKEHFYYNPLGDLERNVLGNQVTHFDSKGEIAHYLLFSAKLPSGAHLQASPNRDYALDLQDIPASHHEPDGLPDQSLTYGVQFYYSAYLAGDIYWANEGKMWAREIDHFAEPTGDLRTAAAQITAGAASDDEKAHKLYDAVQALENLTFSPRTTERGRDRKGREQEAHNAAQVWSEKTGTRNEIARLYLALARAAGLQASAMAIADREERIFDPGFLSLDQLTATLVVLKINGANVFLDPGEKLLPYGQLRWSHTLSGGLLETGDGTNISSVTPPNSAKDAITAHTAELTIDGQGAVMGSVKILLNGPEALRLRQLNMTTDAAELKRQVSESLTCLLPESVSGEVTTVQGLETGAGYVSIAAKVSGQLGTVTGKRIVLPGFFFSRGGQFFVEDKRETPVDFHFAEQVIDDAVYHFPAGFTIESAPAATQLAWPEHAALVVKAQPGNGTIEMKHILARASVMLEPKEYPALRDYYQKIAVTNQQQIVLSPAGATPGN